MKISKTVEILLQTELKCKTLRNLTTIRTLKTSYLYSYIKLVFRNFQLASSIEQRF